MALQEFLASYAVKVDEDGARRLQRILDQNQKSASDLTSSFTSARRALSLLKAELSDASGLKDIFASLSSGFSNLSLPKLSGDALSSLGGTAGSMSLKVTADTSAAGEALESFRAKAEALRPKLSANATGITSAVSSAIAAVRSMMSSVSITIPVKAKATLDTSGLSAGSSGSSGASGSSPGTLVMGSVGRKLGIGGRVDRPTVAMIAEEGDPEYVIPVRNESRALPLLRSMLGELSESARLSLSGMLAESAGKSSLASMADARPSVKETLSMLTDAARSSFGLSGGGQPAVSHSVQAPVNITVNAAAAPAETVGQVIYDTTRRSLLKTLEGVFA